MLGGPGSCVCSLEAGSVGAGLMTRAAGSSLALGFIGAGLIFLGRSKAKSSAYLLLLPSVEGISLHAVLLGVRGGVIYGM